MTLRQPSWTKYESAILLEALVATIDGSLSRSDAIKKVSITLRKMAINHGIEIDEIYRNENGISFQMHSMESAYYGRTIFKPATRLFIEVANLYHDSPSEYRNLLKEAKAMINKPKTVEEDFMQYLAKKVSPTKIPELYNCYSEIESFCLKLKVLRKPLFQTTDFEIIKKVYRTIEQNKLFRITRKKRLNKILAACRHYYVYVKEGCFPQIDQEVKTEEEDILSSSINAHQSEQSVENIATLPLTRTEQDDRLLKKYPAIYKRIYTALRKSSEDAISIGKLSGMINHIARPAVLEEILDNVSWAKTIGDDYVFSWEIVDHSITINDADCPQEGNVPAEEATANTKDNVAEHGNTDSAAFALYLKNTLRMIDATRRSYVLAINNCETFAKEHHLDSWQLYAVDRIVAEETIRLLMSNEDFREYNARHRNRFSAALQNFLAFIGGDFPRTAHTDHKPEVNEPYKNEPFEGVLSRYFTKGFRMDSPLEIRKFRRYYSAIHETELTVSDDEISNSIKALCVVYDGKAFLPKVMLSEELRDKLFEYIDTAFAEGKTAIYYQAIYAEFDEAFLDHHIHNADMLKAYLAAMGNGRFYINRTFISKEPNVTLDPLSEIRSCLIGYGRLVEYDELFEALPHLPKSKIKYILANNGEFVNNGQGAYFHEKIVHLSEDEIEGIVAIISQTIADKDFIGGNELYDAIKAKYSYIIEENRNLSIYGFRDALKAKLGDKFSFKGNIISKLGHELSMADVFAKYARTHDNFTLSELQGLASNLATAIYFDAVYENSLRISKEQFVSKDMAQFSVVDTDEALDRICTGKYIPIRGVENFGIFPYAGFTWNSYLLEHYVASYSRKYKLLHSGFNGTECAGAIVRRSAGIESFDDLIVDILVNNRIEMKKTPALQFLNDNGYLARRRYSEIETLIIKAKAQKQRKDED